MQRRTKFPKGLHDGNSDTAFCLGLLNFGRILVNAAYPQHPTSPWSCTARLLSDITQFGCLNPEPRADCRLRGSLFIRRKVAMELILHPQTVLKNKSSRHLSNNQSSYFKLQTFNPTINMTRVLLSGMFSAIWINRHQLTLNRW